MPHHDACISELAATTSAGSPSTQPAVSLRLVIIYGEPLGASLLVEQEALVGRDESVALTIDHGSVSRIHAKLKWEGSGWFVEDCGSTNGTYVNGTRVTLSAPLNQDDIVAFGAVVLKTYLLDRPRAVQEPTADDSLDPVSGALAPDIFRVRLAAAVEDAYRQRVPVSLLRIEVNRFDELVRRHGPELGDTLLREVAGVLSARIRHTDMLGRSEGVAFDILLSQVPMSIAHSVTKRLRTAVEQHALPSQMTQGELTVTCGVASTEGRWISAEELSEEVDIAIELAELQQTKVAAA